MQQHVYTITIHRKKKKKIYVKIKSIYKESYSLQQYGKKWILKNESLITICLLTIEINKTNLQCVSV